MSSRGATTSYSSLLPAGASWNTDLLICGVQVFDALNAFVYKEDSISVKKVEEEEEEVDIDTASINIYLDETLDSGDTDQLRFSP